MPVDPNGATCRDADGVNMNDIAYVVESKGSANVAAIGLLSDTWNISLDHSGLFIQWQGDTVDGQIGTFGLAAFDLFRGFTRPFRQQLHGDSLPGLSADGGLRTRLCHIPGCRVGFEYYIMGPLGTQTAAKNTNGAYDGLVDGSSPTDLVDYMGIAPFYWNSTATPNGDGTTAYVDTTMASGNYTVAAPGGTAVNAFTGTLDISSAAASFAWANVSTFDGQTAPQIPRNTPLNITWTGGDPQGFVDITLIASTVESSYPSLTQPEPAVYVECVAELSKGPFSVPTYVLQALPPAVNSGSFVSGVVLVGQTNPVTKISPTPTGLDAAYLYYRIVSGYTVQWE